MNAEVLALEKTISPTRVYQQTSKYGASPLKKSEILTNALTYIESVNEQATLRTRAVFNETAAYKAA